MSLSDELKLVLFDFDGTLCDSASTIIHLMQRAAEEVGVNLPDEKTIRGNIGYGVAHVALDYAGGDEALAEQLALRYRKLSQETYYQPEPPLDPLFDGAVTCLNLLSEQGYLLGIATNKSRAPLLSLLQRHQIDTLFDVVMSVDDAPAKPSGEMAREALRRTGADASHTVLVGDTIIDAGCAEDARIAFLGVEWGYHPVAALQQKGAKEIISDFAQLPEILHRILP